MLKPKFLYAMVRIRSDRFANFLDYFHNQSNDDQFKLLLNKIVQSHIKLTKVTEESFKSPVKGEGFYFKTIPKTTCKTHTEKPCIINDIYETDAYCKFKVQPYDFLADGKRIVGISITLLEANAKLDKN